MTKLGRCKYCGRITRVAWLPNHGHATIHHWPGDRATCDKLRAAGRDIVSNQARIDARNAKDKEA